MNHTLKSSCLLLPSFIKGLQIINSTAFKSPAVNCLLSRSIKSQPTFNPEEVPKEIALTVTNRNPRNLERLRIARKPKGYKLEQSSRRYWHKLSVIQTNRHVTCRVIHNDGKTVISACSSEWPIKKRLFSCQDKVAYETLGKVLAQRCIESGIECMYWDEKSSSGEKLESLLKALTDGGVFLREPGVYVDPHPWHKHRPEKPWEVHE